MTFAFRLLAVALLLLLFIAAGARHQAIAAPAAHGAVAMTRCGSVVIAWRAAYSPLSPPHHR